MKRVFGLFIAVLMLFSMAACGSKVTYKDGEYYAEGEFDSDSGWKDTVTIVVSGGKITGVNWNGLNKDGGDDKKTASENGSYDMSVAGAKSAWHEQAKSMEDKLIDVQDPSKIKVKSDGSTDAVTGVSITVSGFTALATEALAKAK